jgi:hypothetical protein
MRCLKHRIAGRAHLVEDACAALSRTAKGGAGNIDEELQKGDVSKT